MSFAQPVFLAGLALVPSAFFTVIVPVGVPSATV